MLNIRMPMLACGIQDRGDLAMRILQPPTSLTSVTTRLCPNQHVPKHLQLLREQWEVVRKQPTGGLERADDKGRTSPGPMSAMRQQQRGWIASKERCLACNSFRRVSLIGRIDPTCSKLEHGSEQKRPPARRRKHLSTPAAGRNVSEWLCE